MNDTPIDPSLALLERWRAGDRSALDALLADILPWLHKEMRRALDGQPRGVQESMDLVQTAVTNFLERGPRFVPQTLAQFRALLKRIATNELIDQWRRHKRAGVRHLESMVNSANPLSGFAAANESGLAPVRQAQRSEEREWVRLALQFLPDDDRWLLLASEVEGTNWEIIASELGLGSADTARMRGARLKPKLANLLRKLRAGHLPEAT